MVSEMQVALAVMIHISPDPERFKQYLLVSLRTASTEEVTA